MTNKRPCESAATKILSWPAYNFSCKKYDLQMKEEKDNIDLC